MKTMKAVALLFFLTAGTAEVTEGLKRLGDEIDELEPEGVKRLGDETDEFEAGRLEADRRRFRWMKMPKIPDPKDWIKPTVQQVQQVAVPKPPTPPTHHKTADIILGPGVWTCASKYMISQPMWHNPASCEKLCRATKGCTHFSMFKGLSNCRMQTGCPVAGRYKVTPRTALGTTWKLRNTASYQHVVKGCVRGHNIVNYPNKSVQECEQLCDARDDCKAFEYGVNHGARGGNKARDCQLQSGANFQGCNGASYNLDLYIKPEQNGEEYCQSGKLSRAQCEASSCCHWNTWDWGRDKCWSSIERRVCTDMK